MPTSSLAGYGGTSGEASESACLPSRQHQSQRPCLTRVLLPKHISTPRPPACLAIRPPSPRRHTCPAHPSSALSASRVSWAHCESTGTPAATVLPSASPLHPERSCLCNTD